MKNNKLISTFNVTQTKSSNLCLFDPIILTFIIIVIILLFYIIGHKLYK